jgi:hypothetical protein
MKKTLTKLGAVSALTLGALGIVSASAMGFPGMNNLSTDELASRQTELFTKQATLIGVSTEEVKNAWAEGKDFLTLAKEKGLTETQLKEKMKAERTAQMKAQMSALVSKGVITQAQADKRIATMEAKASAKKEGRGGKGMKGFSF